MKSKLLITSLLALTLSGCSSCKNPGLYKETTFELTEIHVAPQQNPFWWLYVDRNEKRDKMVIYHDETD